MTGFVLGSKMSPSRKVVLIVDDNPLNRHLLSKTLAEHHTAIEAGDGLEALSILERQSVDFVVSDVLMPNLDGYGLCREVRRRPELKTVFLILYTATSFSPDDEELSLECGADKFLNKQGTPKVILKVIEEVMKERRERSDEYLEATNVSTPEIEIKKYQAGMILPSAENSLQIEHSVDGLRNLHNGHEKPGGERMAELANDNQRLDSLNVALEQRVATRTDELAAQNAVLESRTKELEARTEQLARATADFEQFASIASHDLQEPLRAVAGCIQIFERRFHGKIDRRSDELIQMILSGSARMKALIDGIQAYSRAGRAEDLEMIDTGAVVQNVLADLNAAISESKTEIVFAGLPSLRFVKTQFEQVVRIIIGNAIKYRSGPGQQVYVRAERQFNGWIFKITDSGIGFEQQYAEQVFGIFKRLHPGDVYTGTGIGLAICKKIVERRGGNVWAESALNQGASFFFSVPDAETASASSL
jgi:signal transduction histidine kinase/CheY-like chemotaxis protein